jgi:ATP-binding cassette subfamily B protein
LFTWFYVKKVPSFFLSKSPQCPLAKPQISLALLRRVWSYARPYRLKILGLLVTIFAITGLSLIPPLLMRDLIDNAIPTGDTTRLNWLALGMIAIPLVNAAIGLGQRWLSATIGESLIADLRNALFKHMQLMSLRFFTQVKSFITYSYGVRVRL